MMLSTHYNFSFFLLVLFFSLVFLNCAMGGRIIPPSAPSTVTRPLVSSSEEEETFVMKPRLDHTHTVFEDRQIKDCLPKGFRHNSAPSRFVNYNTLSSSSASSCNSQIKHWEMRIITLSLDSLVCIWLGIGKERKKERGKINAWVCCMCMSFAFVLICLW